MKLFQNNVIVTLGECAADKNLKYSGFFLFSTQIVRKL